MAYRTEKSGIAAEAQHKIQSKFDSQLATQILVWINEVSGQGVNTDGSPENFYETLKNGLVLCRLANCLKADSIKKPYEGTMPFKCMENINNFLNFAENVADVPKHETFMTVDLWEEQNLNSVLTCLASLARKASKFGKPTLGPKEASGEKREWSEEQLKAGEGVIGLQMGTNKGASQAGMNIGKTRHILD